jgi:hypothetical protein
VFPVRYGLSFYMLFRRNSVFKGLILNALINLYRGIPLATCFHSFVYSESKSRIFCATDVRFCCLAYATLEDLVYFHYYENIWMGVANTKHSLKNNDRNKFGNSSF